MLHLASNGRCTVLDADARGRCTVPGSDAPACFELTLQGARAVVMALTDADYSSAMFSSESS